ncbi:MAG: hypothetical protein STHCBS139747_005178 [Sporothrix thermara]
MSVPKNLVVVGGSYVGVNVAQQLAAALSDRFRVVLIEKNSHFNHLFAFPRFAATTKVDTKKAFIPYNPGTFASAPGIAGANTVVQARATGLTRTAVELDRPVSLAGSDGHKTAPVSSIPYEYLVLVTGTQLMPPSNIPGTEKKEGVSYLQHHAAQVERAHKIAIIGGGAVGVQMATDIKEMYPDKSVTLVHSRPTVMNRFHTDLDAIVKARFAELGVETKLGSRVASPKETTAAAHPGETIDVVCEDGSRLPTELAIVCTGQTPQSGLLAALSPSSINEAGFIKVRDTLQVQDPALDNIFAIGDVADTGAHKAARPAAKQATVVVQNIQHLLNNEPLDKYTGIDPAGIHMTLGLTKNIIFRNPFPGEKDPSFDMNIDGVWARRGGGPDSNL